jgi:hypothetical protein
MLVSKCKGRVFHHPRVGKEICNPTYLELRDERAA